MSTGRLLALAAAALTIQTTLPLQAQASAMLASDFQPAAVSTQDHGTLGSAIRLTLPTPMSVSLESSMPYGRTVASSKTWAATTREWRSAGGLAAESTPWNALNKHWQSDGKYWQFDESPNRWHWHVGNWYSSDFDHHGNAFDDDIHPPAVPIPATAYLFAGGLALLAFVRRAAYAASLAAAVVR